MATFNLLHTVKKIKDQIAWSLMNEQFEESISQFDLSTEKPNFQHLISENKRGVGLQENALYLLKHLSNLPIQTPSTLTTHTTT